MARHPSCPSNRARTWRTTQGNPCGDQDRDNNRGESSTFPCISTNLAGDPDEVLSGDSGNLSPRRSLLNRDNVSLTKMNEFDVSPSFRCFAFSIRAWRKRNGIQDEMEESFGTRIRLLLGEEWIEFGTPFVRTHPRFSHDDPCELLIVFASSRMSNREKYWW